MRSSFSIPNPEPSSLFPRCQQKALSHMHQNFPTPDLPQPVCFPELWNLSYKLCGKTLSSLSRSNWLLWEYRRIHEFGGVRLRIFVHSPLHAAGTYAPKQKNLTDLYVSSYTSTLSALIAARSGTIQSCDSTVPNILLVAQPDETIPAVAEEVLRIQNFGPFVHTLLGAAVTKDKVLSDLEQHSWVHFACHGHRDAHPFQSSFNLHDDE